MDQRKLSINLNTSDREMSRAAEIEIATARLSLFEAILRSLVAFVIVALILVLSACFTTTQPDHDFLREHGLRLSARKGFQPAKLPNFVTRNYGSLNRPLKGGHLTSKFGKRWGSFHEGVDFGADFGTSILAAHDGEVIFAGNGPRGYGLMVVVRGVGIYTLYAHARSLSVEAGDIVESGDTLAEVGDTGRASGPHLHFEVRFDSGDGELVAVNPYIFFKISR